MRIANTSKVGICDSSREVNIGLCRDFHSVFRSIKAQPPGHQTKIAAISQGG